jgi:type II secretory pathway pseudopilin PulG
MILVALAMISIIAMAALSIDVITLYLAREEAQRSADQAALAAARVISLSGMTGDPSNSALSWQAVCGPPNYLASQVATAVGQQDAVGGLKGTITVTYSPGSSSSWVSDCSTLPATFGVNPTVKVVLQRPALPTFFSRIWGSGGSAVSASAIAEAFNPSGTGTTGTITPVQPRCVKPWIVPNRDPLNPQPKPQLPSGYLYCDQAGGPGACTSLVSPTDGSITHSGISLNGSSANGVIGETFWLSPDCVHTGTACGLRQPQPGANYVRAGYVQGPPNLQFVPAADPPSSPVAVPSWATGMDFYEQAIAGCDQSTVYECGVQSTVELGGGRGNIDFETADAVLPLIREADLDMPNDGQDTIDTSPPYPFRIVAGSATPLSGLGGIPVTSSVSVVSLPIYDSTNDNIAGGGTSPVTIIGFLQVFMNQVDQYGNVKVTILNVAGCGNGSNSTGSPVTGSSPVPVRLITPP